MSYLLSIYSTKAFKEFLLPAINNADSSVIINKNIFSLPVDVEISLEIIENQWYIRQSEEYTLQYTATKELYAGKALQNGDLLTIHLNSDDIINIIVKEKKNSFSVYKKYNISKAERITIGKQDNCCIQYDVLNLISREHGVIRREENQFIVEDMSANGIFINSVRMAGSWQLAFGDCIDIFGLRMVFLGDILAINEGMEGLVVDSDSLQLYRNIIEKSVSEIRRSEEPQPFLFHRSPRKMYKLSEDKIEIEAPPALKERDKQPLGMLIGPSLTMALPMLLGCGLSIYSTRTSGGASSAFMYTGLVTAVSSALVGVSWTLVNLRYSKKKNREEELRRFEAYGEYLIKCANLVKEKYEGNIRALKEMYPSAEVCCKYSHATPMLWNRNVSHSDILFERLGIGDIPFQVEVEIPKEKFTLMNDSLAEKPRMIKESYQTLHEVPVGVDLLKHPLIGIFGGEKKKGALSVVYNLVAQIAANNCYTDVKLVFIYDEKKYEDAGVWSFTRWLPHVWSEDKRTRYVAKDKSEASDVLYELTKVLRIRQEESEGFGERRKKLPKPYYIMFIANPEFLEGELISKYIFEPKEDYGLTAFLVEEEYNALPNACEYLIQNDEKFKGVYSIAAENEERMEVKFDLISAAALDEMGRKLSNVEVNEIETGGEIPNALTFFEMYRINRLDDLNVLDRWRKNRTYESMKALIGKKSGGVDCYLDVHEKYHGPHGLVAGTTGSGKSETLQTYMLSLAINFSPDDVGFFVIDYKGGGMANLFSGLPHMIGQISNLSGNQVHRAMVSIKSENMRRQRIFNEHGVNNINLYTKLYKNNEASLPIPHMFIIIDEFAELKREEPDFMRELISVAQVGRSLGVHLVLATQKPSGTVDDNIWSNSKFKLCLRVQDRQDSNDMLHKPDAAYITQAGRCYLQVGNDELYELFQSGYSGAAYEEDEAAVKTDIAKMISNTGKAALTGSRTKLKRKDELKRAWIGRLVEILSETEEKLAVTVSDLTGDFESRDQFIDMMFALMKKKEIDYAESEYNVRRLEELLQVYDACSKDGQDKDELVSAMLDYAGREGKKLPEMKEKTQLDAVVEYLNRIAKENGYVHNLQLWLPVLPETLYLDELEGYTQSAYENQQWKDKRKEKGFHLSCYMGLCDDPVNQAQMPLILDLAENGHHAVCGTVVSGKSTFLQTMVYSLIHKYTPEEINIYGIDYGSKMLQAFEQAPQVGGIVYESEPERLDKLLTMLGAILEERKELFKGGNYSQYIQANGTVLPAIVVVIDSFANFRSKTDNRYENFFIQLCKDGVGYGIFVVMTAAGFGTLEIPNRIGDNIRTVLTLEMGDKFQYADAMRTMRVDVLPEENIKGRGLVRIGESILEYQTALALRAEDDFKRSEEIAVIADDMRKAWKGECARPIPEIPKNFVWADFAETKEVQKLFTDDRHLPIGYNMKTVAAYGIDLSRTYCYLITGKRRSGKTNMLKVMLQSAALKGGKIAAVDFGDELKALCGKNQIMHINEDEALYHYFSEELLGRFKERNQKKCAWLAEGLSDEEIYDNMKKEERIFIFVANLADFIQHIYHPAENVQAMSGFVENLLDKGSLHNVFWITVLNPDDVNKVSGMKAYHLITKYKQGVHFGGAVSEQRIFNFDYIPYMEQSKPEKTGIAMLPASEEENVRKVVIPLHSGHGSKDDTV